MVSIRVVQSLVDFVERAGISRAQFLRSVDLDPTQLETGEVRLPRTAIYRLCEAAIDHTGDAALGLHWGETFGERSFVPIAPLVHHAGSLRQALEALSNFNRLLSDRTGYQVLEQDDELRIRCLRMSGESVRVQRFIAEFMMIGFLRLARTFYAKARPERVLFEYAAPDYHAEYTRVFQGDERFAQPFTEIVFDRELLNISSQHNDEDVHEALRAVAERRIIRLGERAPYALRVRDLLVEQGPHRTSMQTVARALGLSVRSLRRRLAEEGKTYGAAASEAFAIVAKRHLRDEQRTIQETAYEMGFSDTSTFHRAFKRWTGMTPSAYSERTARKR